MNEDIEIRQIVKFAGDGYGKAAVTLRVGPLVIHGARIMEKDGRRWLSLPSRPSNDGKWFRIVSCESTELSREIERLALEAYDATPMLEAEIARAL